MLVPVSGNLVASAGGIKAGISEPQGEIPCAPLCSFGNRCNNGVCVESVLSTISNTSIPGVSNTSNWKSVTSSADGSRLAALIGSGYIYTSADYGASWVQRSQAGVQTWQAITSSADGMKLFATYYGLYTSYDGGDTWTQQAAIGGNDLRAIASSADGTKLVTGRLS